MRASVADGFAHVKMKVGADLEDDDRRASLIRRALGPDGVLMMDANQVWGVDEAIEAMTRLGVHDPWWIEEPTSPDDILGHARIETGDRADPRRDRRARAEPGRVQAALPGRGDRRLPARRVPDRRGQRGDRDSAPGREIRDPGVSPRGWRRSLRVRAAPRAVRLHRRRAGRSRTAWSNGWIISTSTSGIPPSCVRDGTWCRAIPATASRCCPNRSTSTRSPARGRLGRRCARRSGNVTMASAMEQDPVTAESTTKSLAIGRDRLLQAGLLALRSGPALILILLVVVVGLTTPVFLTSRNIGNVCSPDLGHRGPRPRPVARDRLGGSTSRSAPTHRALGRGRCDRLRARRPRACS